MMYFRVVYKFIVLQSIFYIDRFTQVPNSPHQISHSRKQNKFRTSFFVCKIFLRCDEKYELKNYFSYFVFVLFEHNERKLISFSSCVVFLGGKSFFFFLCRKRKIIIHWNLLLWVFLLTACTSRSSLMFLIKSLSTFYY